MFQLLPASSYTNSQNNPTSREPRPSHPVIASRPEVPKNLVITRIPPAHVIARSPKGDVSIHYCRLLRPCLAMTITVNITRTPSARSRHCEERSDEAIHPLDVSIHIPLTHILTLIHIFILTKPTINVIMRYQKKLGRHNFPATTKRYSYVQTR